MQRMFWYLILLNCLLWCNAFSPYKCDENSHLAIDVSPTPAINCTNAPIFLSFSDVGTQSVTLSWMSTNSPTETAWDIEIAPAAIGFSGTPTHTNISENPYTLSDLQAGTRYCYRVRANCGATHSAWSSTQVCFQTHIVNPSACGIGFPIDDNNCGTKNEFPIIVQNTDGNTLGSDIRLREVQLLIDHNWEQDLRLQLQAPDGSIVNLSTDRGGSSVNPPYGDVLQQDCSAYTAFHNHAVQCTEVPSIADPGLTTFTGTFLPEVPFSNFDGSPANGTWTLIVCDDASPHLGTLEYVALIFEKTNCTEPSDVQISSVTTSSFIVDWDVNGSNLPSEISLFPVDDPDAELLVTGIYPPYTFNNLSAGTTYKVLVRQQCGLGIASPNACAQYATTNCITFAATLIENFDDQATCNTNCTSTCSWNGIWQNDSDATSQWLIHTGSTPTPNTGPTADASGSGNYIYLETSNGFCQNTEAVLQSNCIEVRATQGTCHFSFDYYMLGNDVQSLRLQILDNEQLIWQTLWQNTGSQGAYWRKAFIDLQAYDKQTVRFRFVATSSDFDTGDIAMDNLVFYGAADMGVPAFVHYFDLDQDGFGDAGISYTSCSPTPPNGYVNNADDCDDANNLIHPDMPEIYCNQLDENCNGNADDSSLPAPSTPTVKTFCPETPIQLTLEEPALGAYEWYDAPVGGNFLFSGNELQLPPASSTDTVYVEDVITIRPGLRITEVMLSFTNSGVELQNIGEAADYTGWKVVLGDNTNDINDALPVYWELGAFAANEVQTRNRNEWGASFTWLSIWNGWVLLLDNQDKITDAVFWNWSFGEIATFDITVDGTNYTFEDLPWLGNGINVPSNCGQALSMVGTLESDAASDFVCSSGSMGSPNPNLNLATTCRSSRSPIVLAVFLPINLETETFTLSCETGVGDIYLSPSGGTPPYQYVWSNQSTEQNIIQVPYDDYWVTVTDANGCSTVLSDPVTLTTPANVYNVEITEVEDVSCFGAKDGTMKAAVSGGIPPYQFNWSAGYERDLDTPFDSLQNLDIGSYTLTVTDGQGCVEVSNVVQITEPTVLQLADIQTQPVECFNDTNGRIAVEITGGMPPYQYHWNTTDTTAILENLSGGVFTLTVNDANDCSKTFNPIIIQTPEEELRANLLSTQDISCHRAADGFIQYDIQGGTAPYVHTWSDPSIPNTAQATGLEGGMYQLTITDALGCSIVTDSVELTEASSPLDVSATTTDVRCNGMQTGAIELHVSGGIAPYDFQWSNFKTTRNIDQLGAGTYFCTITDTNGCTFFTPAIWVLSDNSEAFTLEITQQIPPNCHNSNDGMIDITVNGGTPPYDFLWNNNTTEEDLLNIDGGLYQCTITDANDCMSTTGNITLFEPPPLLIESAIIVNDTLSDDSGGSISVNVKGGTPPYFYDWNDPDMQSTSMCVGLSQGIYTVSVTDTNGCSYVASYYVDGSTSTSAVLPIFSTLKLYPNPAQQYAWLDLTIKNPQSVSIRLIDIFGKIVSETNLPPSQNIHQRIDTEQLVSGVYFVQIQTEGAQQSLRLVVQ